MRLLAIPLVAIFSSGATNWYWMGRQHRATDGQRSDRLQVEQWLRKDLQRQVDDLQAQLKQREPVQDVSRSVCHSDALATTAEVWKGLQEFTRDFVVFGGDTVASTLWPWPADNATASLVSEAASAVESQAAALTAGVAGPGLAAWEHLVLVGRGIAAVAADGVSAARAVLPQEVEAIVVDLGAVVRDHLAAVSRALHSSKDSFLEQYPQHRSLVGEHDPVTLVVCLAFMVALVVLDFFVALKFLQWAVGLCASHVSSRFCWCCRGRSEEARARRRPKSKKDKPRTPPAAVKAAACSEEDAEGLRMAGAARCAGA